MPRRAAGAEEEHAVPEMLIDAAHYKGLAVGVLHQAVADLHDPRLTVIERDTARALLGGTSEIAQLWALLAGIHPDALRRALKRCAGAPGANLAADSEETSSDGSDEAIEAPAGADEAVQALRAAAAAAAGESTAGGLRD